MDDQDKKIADLVIEVKKTKEIKPNLSHAEIKTVLKSQGTDDELDMAIVLAEVEPVNWTTELIKTMIWSLVIIGIIFIFDLVENIFGVNFIGGQWYFFVVVLAVSFFCIRNVSYRQKYFNELLAHDFGFQELTAEMAQKYLVEIKGVPDDAKVEKVLKCEFDGRETYFGFFEWTRGSGKNRRTYHRTFVMQVMDKSFDQILIQPHLIEGWNFLGEDVRLESNEFNDKFIVKTGGNPKNAFYTLNPRVMETILKEFDQYKFNLALDY